MIHIVLASLIVSQPVQADDSLRASLEYEILAEPYDNFVKLDMFLPGVAVDRSRSSPHYGTIYAVGGDGSSLTVQRSVDGGRSFDGPFFFDLCDRPFRFGCGSPDVAVGKLGTVYVASDELIFRSTDQGLSWTTVGSFSSGFANSDIETDAATGTVHYAAIDASNYDGTTFDIVVTNSVDGGQTWAPPVTVSTAGTGRPQVAASAGDVVIVFSSTNTSTGQVAVAKAASHDGGVTWSTPSQFSPSDMAADLSSPSVAVSPGGVFAVSWSASVAGSAADVLATFVSVSRDRGDSFSEPIEVSRYPGRVYFGPLDAIAFDDLSRLYVTWLATEFQAAGRIYVANSTDFGQHFASASFVGGRRNESVDQSLAPGIEGHIYLTCVCEHLGTDGTYFRGVTGEASGEILSGGTPESTTVEVELVDASTAAVRARATWLGSPLVLAELPPSSYDVWVRVGDASALAGRMPVLTWNRTAFAIHVEGGPGSPGPSPFPWITAAAVGGIVLIAAAALVALQHTRLARQEVLQRQVRLLIYNAICAHPGISFTEVRNAIGLRNGVAAYHLNVLEKQGLVHSEKGRRHRWYYPNGDVSLWRNRPLSPLQRALLEKVGTTPGIGIRELSRSLNRRHGSVAYNVKGLALEGLLRTERVGQKVQCFPADESGAPDAHWVRTLVVEQIEGESTGEGAAQREVLVLVDRCKEFHRLSPQGSPTTGRCLSFEGRGTGAMSSASVGHPTEPKDAGRSGDKPASFLDCRFGKCRLWRPG